MPTDARGLAISTTSSKGTVAWDHLIAGYLSQRADTPDRVAALFDADQNFILAHCIKGYFSMMAYKQATIPVAKESLETARSLLDNALPRERLHVEALKAWIEGDLNRTISIWESILRSDPLDVLAFRLSHFANFWLGRPQDMTSSVERILPFWSEDTPGFSSILACHSFAHEEAGNYFAAEPSGRRSIDMDPDDLWAAHAIAHVMEMQGRRSEGIDWLTRLSPNWEGSHNMQHHLWWHLALFKFEHGDVNGVLDLYDTRFRNLNAPLTVASPDVYIDVQNAASMLYRLDLAGIDVGSRWVELADKAESRIGDCVSAFTLPHWMMALTATNRTEAAKKMIRGMRNFTKQSGTVARIVRDYALPIAEAQLAFASGKYTESVDLMRPAIGGMYQMGGSHAQQDILDQFFAHAAIKADSSKDVNYIVERATGRRVIPLERFAGWRPIINKITSPL